MIIYSLQGIFISNLALVDCSKRNELGRSVFNILMQQGIVAEKKKHRLLRRLMSKIEETFFFLISKAEEKMTEEEINRIIESPDHSGSTLFMGACLVSEKISEWILNRNIDVASVNDQWLTPQFIFESNFEKMLKKGINPFIVDYSGKSEFDVRNFENIDQTLLQSFITGKITNGKTEAYYSFQDSKCNHECANSCKNNMQKFKLYTGKREFQNEKTGGEGIVSFGTWHGKPAAFKRTKLGEIEDVVDATDVILNAEKTRAEFETASKLSHPSILKVLHVFRYQETEKIGNYRSLQNWTIIVMEKHDQNIGELELYQRIYLPYLLQDALGTVFNKY